MISDTQAAPQEMMASENAAPATEQPASEVERLRRALDERIEFIEDMSHELRSGLTFVRGYVDLFLSGGLGPVNEKQAYALGVMSRRTDAIVHLLDQMLSLERAKAGHLERQDSVDLAELLHHVAETAQPAASQAGLTLRVEARPCCVEQADPRRLLQVVENLVSNAIKFSREGGVVSLACREEDNWVEVTVRDQGVGIAPEDREHVFERFYRGASGSGQASGSGLGLVIAKEIVEAHGGRIWVESELGKGSCFFVRLPRRALPGSQSAPARPAAGWHKDA